MGWTPAEEQAPTEGLTSSPGPRTRPRKLRRLYIYRTPHRRCRIDNAMVYLAPYSRWSKAELVDREMLKANMRVNM